MLPLLRLLRLPWLLLPLVAPGGAPFPTLLPLPPFVESPPLRASSPWVNGARNGSTKLRRLADEEVVEDVLGESPLLLLLPPPMWRAGEVAPVRPEVEEALLPLLVETEVEASLRALGGEEGPTGVGVKLRNARRSGDLRTTGWHSSTAKKRSSSWRRLSKKRASSLRLEGGGGLEGARNETNEIGKRETWERLEKVTCNE